MAAAIVRALKAVGYRYVTPRSRRATAPAASTKDCSCGRREHRRRPQRSRCARERSGSAGSAVVVLSRSPFSRCTCRICPRRSKISTRSTSRSASATSTSRTTSRIRPAIRCSSLLAKAVHACRSSERRARSACSASSPARSACWRMAALFGRLDERRRGRALVAAGGAAGADGAAVLVHGGAAAERHAGACRGAGGAGADARRRTTSARLRVAAFCAGLADGHSLAGGVAHGAVADRWAGASG